MALIVLCFPLIYRLGLIYQREFDISARLAGPVIVAPFNLYFTFPQSVPLLVLLSLHPKISIMLSEYVRNSKTKGKRKCRMPSLVRPTGAVFFNCWSGVVQCMCVEVVKYYRTSVRERDNFCSVPRKRTRISSRDIRILRIIQYQQYN